MTYVSIALAVGSSVSALSIFKLFISSGIQNSAQVIKYSMRGSRRSVLLSGPIYQALSTTSSIHVLSGWKMNGFRVRAGNEYFQVKGYEATGNAFSVFALKPLIGRFFTPSDDVPGGGEEGWAAVIGYAFWKAHFSGDSNVVGKVIYVDSKPVRIVGVLPQDFRGVSPLVPPNIVLPRSFADVSGEESDFAKPGLFTWYVFGVLPPNVMLKSVQADLQLIESSVRRQADPTGKYLDSPMFRGVPRGSLITASDIRFGISSIPPGLSRPFYTIAFLASIVCIFCSCNLALLYFVRAHRDRHEMAIRTALGCSTPRRVRDALLQALFDALSGIAFSLPIAIGVQRVLSTVFQSIPGLSEFPALALDLRLIAGVTSMILICVSLCVAIIAIFQNDLKLGQVFSQGAHGSQSNLANRIIGCEIFAASLLLVVACSDYSVLKTASRIRTGFGVRGIGLAYIDTNSSRADSETSPDIQARVLERIKNYPGVQAVATTSISPLNGTSSSSTLGTIGHAGAINNQEVWSESVSTDYFRAIGTKIAYGRAFNKDDSVSAKVCVIGLSAAAALFKETNPLGQTIYQELETEGRNSKPREPYCRVIGVSEDVHFSSLLAPVDTVVYRLSQSELPNIIVLADSSEAAVDAIQDAFQGVDPASLAGPVESIESRADDDLKMFRAVTLSAETCAGIASMIMGIGVYGILALLVTERSRDIGILISLGAGSTNVISWLVRRLAIALVTGMAFGLLGSYLIGGEMLPPGEHHALVFPIYLWSGLFIAIPVICAVLVPVQRALSLAPVDCLRKE